MKDHRSMLKSLGLISLVLFFLAGCSSTKKEVLIKPGRRFKMFLKKLIPGRWMTRSPFLWITGLLLAAVILFAQVPQAHANMALQCTTKGRLFRLWLEHPPEVGGLICNWNLHMEEITGYTGMTIWRFGPTYSCTPASERQVIEGEIKYNLSNYLNSQGLNECSEPSNWR